MRIIEPSGPQRQLHFPIDDNYISPVPQGGLGGRSPTSESTADFAKAESATTLAVSADSPQGSPPGGWRPLVVTA